MAAYDQGITLPYQSVNAGVIQPDVFGIAINFFINRTPFASRLGKAPTGAMSFKLTNDAYRPRTTTISADVANGSTTSVTATDGTLLDVGDVLQMDSEYLQVTAISGNTLTVVRGVAGTSGAGHTASGLTVYIVTNARTGGEIDQNALSRIPVTTTQYLQTVQHAYQISGALESATNYISGEGGPLQRDKRMCMQHCMDDLEGAILYGKAAGLSGSVTRQQMAGWDSILTTNRVTSPTNAGAYKPSDLIRDTIQRCRNNGGEPNTLVVSEDFLSGLSVWGHNAQRLNAGSNAFGTPINLFWVPFLPSLTIVEHPFLRTGSVICFNDQEARIRVKRPLADLPRGRRGDAVEGDMILEAALEVDNESHHAMVSGITAFSAT